MDPDHAVLSSRAKGKRPMRPPAAASLAGLPHACQQRIARQLSAHDMLALGQTCLSWREVSLTHPQLRASLAWPDPALCVTARTMARKWADMTPEARTTYLRMPYLYTRPDAYQLAPYGLLYPVNHTSTDTLQQMAARSHDERARWLIKQRLALTYRISSATNARGWLDDRFLSADDRRFFRTPLIGEPSTPSEISRVGSLLLSFGALPSQPVAIFSGLNEDDAALCDTDEGPLSGDGSGACSVLAMIADTDYDDPCHHWVRAISNDLFADNRALVEQLWGAALHDSTVLAIGLARGFDPAARGLFSDLDLPGTLLSAAPEDPARWSRARVASWYRARQAGWDLDAQTQPTASGPQPLRAYLQQRYGPRADRLLQTPGDASRTIDAAHMGIMQGRPSSPSAQANAPDDAAPAAGAGAASRGIGTVLLCIGAVIAGISLTLMLPHRYSFWPFCLFAVCAGLWGVTAFA